MPSGGTSARPPVVEAIWSPTPLGPGHLRPITGRVVDMIAGALGRVLHVFHELRIVLELCPLVIGCIDRHLHLYRFFEGGHLYSSLGICVSPAPRAGALKRQGLTSL